MIKNDSELDWNQFESLLAAAARLMVYRGHKQEAAMLAGATGEMARWKDGRWQDHVYHVLTLGIPVEAYCDLGNAEEAAAVISRTLIECGNGLDGFDDVRVLLRPHVAEADDWRDHIKRMLVGEGVNNQGRAHSRNVAPISFNGLLFRSPPEVEFFKALLETGVPIAPLPVVVAQRARKHRIEPDFVVYFASRFMVVELDGPNTHRETPAQAHERLEFLTDQGCLVWRVSTAACDTPEKAKAEVRRALLKMGWKPPLFGQG